MSRPVIVGMNNPLSMNPSHALYPYPRGCTGYRLWRMLEERCGAMEHEYIERFRRMNLTVGPWDKDRARESVYHLLPALAGCHVLLLGEDVRRAFDLPKLLIAPLRWEGVIFRQLPHPSGRSRWYNDPTNRALAGMVLEEMYESHQSR